jgi:hypothetical protein
MSRGRKLCILVEVPACGSGLGIKSDKINGEKRAYRLLSADDKP